MMEMTTPGQVSALGVCVKFVLSDLVCWIVANDVAAAGTLVLALLVGSPGATGVIAWLYEALSGLAPDGAAWLQTVRCRFDFTTDQLGELAGCVTGVAVAGFGLGGYVGGEYGCDDDDGCCCEFAEHVGSSLSRL